MRSTEYSRGTRGYRAPELIRDGKSGYNNKVDIWSLGCILYELVVGERAFSDDWSVLEYFRRGRRLEFPKWSKGFSAAQWEVVFSSLINDMLSFEPKRRPRLCNMLRRFAFHYEIRPLVENYFDPLHYRPATVVGKPLFPTKFIMKSRDASGPSMSLTMTHAEKRFDRA